MNKIIMSFEDDLTNINNYIKLGFKVEIDDVINNIYSVELDLSEYDMLSVLNMCEECLSYNLHPFVILDDVYYSLNNNDDLKVIDILVSLNPLII